jgi:hypothetical protein
MKGHLVPNIMQFNTYELGKQPVLSLNPNFVIHQLYIVSDLSSLELPFFSTAECE